MLCHRMDGGCGLELSLSEGDLRLMWKPLKADFGRVAGMLVRGCGGSLMKSSTVTGFWRDV